MPDPSISYSPPTRKTRKTISLSDVLSDMQEKRSPSEPRRREGPLGTHELSALLAGLGQAFAAGSNNPTMQGLSALAGNISQSGLTEQYIQELEADPSTPAPRFISSTSAKEARTQSSLKQQEELASQQMLLNALATVEGLKLKQGELELSQDAQDFVEEIKKQQQTLDESKLNLDKKKLDFLFKELGMQEDLIKAKTLKETSMADYYSNYKDGTAGLTAAAIKDIKWSVATDLARRYSEAKAKMDEINLDLDNIDSFTLGLPDDIAKEYRSEVDRKLLQSNRQPLFDTEPKATVSSEGKGSGSAVSTPTPPPKSPTPTPSGSTPSSARMETWNKFLAQDNVIVFDKDNFVVKVIHKNGTAELWQVDEEGRPVPYNPQRER